MEDTVGWSIDSYTCHSPVSAPTARPPLWVNWISVITMLAIVGMAFQDLATGWLAYCRARELGIGRSLDFRT